MSEEDSSSSKDEDDEVRPRKLKKLQDIDDKKAITRGRMGIMLPEKNAFEFVHRPRVRDT